MVNSVDPDQSAPIGAVCSGYTLFASILNSSLLLGSYLLQTTSADDIFSCIFFTKMLKYKEMLYFRLLDGIFFMLISDKVILGCLKFML